MANNILEPAYLEIIQREAAYREQLRQQQLAQELQLTNDSQPGDYEPGPEPQDDAREPMAPTYAPEDYEREGHEPEDYPAAASAPPRTTTVGAGLSLPAAAGPAQRAGQRHRREKQKPIRLEYHSPQCTICNHPEREDIERAILHWHSPTVIAYEFDLADRRIVYRHAHALGLFRLRAQQSRHALGFLIEQAQSIVPTADAIIRAVRALACIDDHGQWHEPRKEVVITHRYEDASVPNDEGDSPNTPPTPPRTRHPRRRPSPLRRKSPRSTRPTAHGDRSLGCRNFCAVRVPDAVSGSSDENDVPTPGVSTFEVSTREPRSRNQVFSSLATRHSFTLRRDRAEGPLPLNWSTRLLTKIRGKFNTTNKTPKIGRHTFGMFGTQESALNSDARPARACEIESEESLLRGSN